MIPEKIGRYQIESELGRGGMAVVYLATDPFMSREVAIKVLPRQFTFDPQFRARFQREAQVIAKLDHPAIVPVYDFGEHDEQPFIVMRYMKGGSLADRLKERGPIPIPEAAEILKRIGSALDEAHEKGIVHRDLKPGNILFDDRGDAFVGDFGIVKMSEATVQYTGNAIIGTPGYMSPEQARGEEEIDGRSDIYSLGAISYEMLTGKLPYQSDTPMGLVMKHILDPVPNVLAERPDLPSNTATVISRAMAKEPNNRFQTCTDIAFALSESATMQMKAGSGQQATVLESPISPQTDMAGTVVESPSWHPKPQTVPPSTGGVSRGVGTGVGTGAGMGYTAGPEKKKGGIPTWVWAIGCLGILCIGGVAALGGFGILGNLLSQEATPTPEIIVEATLTIAATATAESPTEAPTATPETAEPTATTASVQPTNTPAFSLPTDTPGSVIPVGGGSISVGATMSGEVASGETQEWTFSANAGDNVDIFVDPVDEFDVVFNVLNAQGVSIIPGGQIDASFGAEQVKNLTIPASGQYRIAVSGFEGTAGSYRVSLVTSPAGSNLFASDTLSAGAEHLFPFTSDRANVTVEAVVLPEGEFDVVLAVFNDDTDTLIDEVDATFTRETMSFRVPAAGNYYFRVTGFEGSSGNYDITIFGPPDVYLLLAHRDEVKSVFDPSTQLDYYFRGDAGEIFTVNVTPDSNIDLVIEIFEEGNFTLPLASVDDNLSGEGEELTFTLPDDSLYVIRVREFFNELGSFTLTID